MIFRHVVRLLVFFVALTGPLTQAAEPKYIVRDGQSNAQIVVAVDAVPVVQYAAADLQTYVKKITGAELPIVNAPTSDAAVQIYVGKSDYTDERGVAVDDLQQGAYRMLSGDNWLILAGSDRPFAPTGNLARAIAKTGTPQGDEADAWWREQTGALWMMPFGQVAKQTHRGYNLSEQDERGSFNAVADYLRSLGVRWYMPGDIGEVVPAARDIKLPQVDKTVRPQFVFRYPYILDHRFGQTNLDNILWQMRMGFNHATDLTAVGHLGHGMDLVHRRPEYQQNYPEHFSLQAGKRNTEGYGEPCLSSPGFLEQQVGFVRALFDQFDPALAPAQPCDGFTNICQCELCKGKGTPQLGWYGSMSNYVWTHINNVAKAVEASHPGKRIACAAYSNYRLPPTNIETLSPALAVGLGQLRARMHDAEHRKERDELRQAWLDKMPEGHKRFVYIYDYYLESWRKNRRGLPAYYPHAIAEDLRSLKGISDGDFIEVGLEGPSVLNLYVTARLWWDPDRDIDAMLDEFCTLFYGPAGPQMKAFIAYSEEHWRDVIRSSEKIDQVNALMAAAQQAAPEDSIYAKRIALVADYIAPLEDLQKQLAVHREDVPLVRFGRIKPEQVTIDGKLDDVIWSGHLRDGDIYLPYQSFGRLKTLVEGEDPKHGTRFLMAWAGKSLVIGIHCADDPPTLNIATEQDNDTNIWLGDCVELLLETQSKSYYQIVINPAGARYEIDRDGDWNTLWQSNAEIATHIGDDGWSVEIRLTPADEEQQTIDVTDSIGVQGRHPSSTYPWYFNICRQRMRDEGNELSAFSPTGEKKGFHDKSRFAKLHHKGL